MENELVKFLLFFAAGVAATGIGYYTGYKTGKTVGAWEVLEAAVFKGGTVVMEKRSKEVKDEGKRDEK